MQFIAPYIALPGWWSMLMTNPLSRPDTPGRRTSPHSMKITVSPTSSRCSRSEMSATPGKSCICCGAGSCATIRTSLPSARSASAIATCEPMASPSGRAWETTTNRWRARIAPATWVRVASVGVVVIGGIGRWPRVGGRGVGGAGGLLLVQVLQDLFDAVLVGDRFVEAELQFGHASHLDPAADLPA